MGMKKQTEYEIYELDKLRTQWSYLDNVTKMSKLMDSDTLIDKLTLSLLFPGSF